jgi:hypothetical protein
VKIIKDYPPNYDVICRAFPIVKSRPNVIFTYGDTLYSPAGNPIPDHLMAHEETHTRQQSENGPDMWWRYYLASPAFRLEQEVEAYRAQYKVLASYGRPERRRIFAQITKDLASAIYGNMVSKEQARKLITA